MDKTVLLIDDELAITRNLGDFLEDYGCSIHTAANGQEGLDSLAEHKPDVIIVDLDMPVMDGYEFTRIAKERHPNLPIIVLSGVGMIDYAMKVVRDGAWDFIPKPLADMRIILYTMEKCLEKSRLIEENEQYQNNLEELVEKRTSQLEKTKRQIINCLGKAAEFKDNETGLHVIRVAEMSHILALNLGLEEDFCQLIQEAAPMHDVGKIGIRDNVLLKNGKLNEEEWDHMQQHTIFGCSILATSQTNNNKRHNICTLANCSPERLLKNDSRNDLITVAKRVALFHHETWDGTGYPFRLAGVNIPIEARIVSLVDVFDAISSKRHYKDMFPEDACKDIIREGRGTKFDPAVVDVFFQCLDTIISAKDHFLD